MKPANYIAAIMKFASALLACSLLLPTCLEIRGDGPDDSFFEAYRTIQEADQLSIPQAPLARQRYQEAQRILERLQSAYPNYSKQAVEFRLDYIREKLKALPAAPEPPQVAVPESTLPRQPATAVAPAQPVVTELTERIARLEADNQLLKAKLQEALAPRPAAVDPAELARAQERIKQLEKEKELLRTGLEQAQATQPNAGDAAMLAKANADLESLRAKHVDSISQIAALTRDNQELRQQLAAAAAQPKPADNSNGRNQVRELEKERDALMKKLNEANKELYDIKARGQAAQFQTLTNQLSNLRARLEVFEARKVPFTPEELALMNKNVPKLAATVDPKAGRKPARELPAGAGILITEAERAFAARRFEEAEQKYKQVLALDEDNPISLANLAAIQIEQQKLEEAEANLKKATAVAPEDPYSTSLLGMLRFQQGKYDEALDALSRAAQLDPKNAETQNYLGITLSQQGQREAAETALRKAIQLNPNYAGAHHNLAVVYATQRPPFIELAKYHYNKALALGQPANPALEKQIGR